MKIGTIEKIFNFLKEKENKELPRNWSVNFPSQLHFIKKFENHPDGVQYRHEGNLFLGYSVLKELPNDLYVEYNLSLMYCKQLTKLPDKLYVGRILDLTHTNITSLPKGLKVGSIEGLKYTNITSLPEGLHVIDILNLRSCYNIDSLPKGLKVDGYLDLQYTNITSLPKGLEVGLGLNLRGLKMRFLPKGLKVDGFLDLRDSKITLLPKGLKVGDSLSIANTPLVKKYTNDEIRDMVKPDGYILGQIYR